MTDNYARSLACMAMGAVITVIVHQIGEPYTLNSIFWAVISLSLFIQGVYYGYKWCKE